MKHRDPWSRDRLLDVVLAAIVGLAAIAFALWMFKAYFDHPQGLWRGLEEDRTGHYLFGLDVALALRTLNPFEVLFRLEKIRWWVPLDPSCWGRSWASAESTIASESCPASSAGS